MMTFEDDFMSMVSDAFSQMRLLAEGAITLFEDEADILCRLARNAEKLEAQLAFNDIGAALYSFRSHIKKLQELHHKAALQEPLGAQETETKTKAIADSPQEPENR